MRHVFNPESATMKQIDNTNNPITKTRITLAVRTCAALLLTSATLVSCGARVDNDTGSESHWLSACNSDVDCGSGACECGLCTQACTSSAECGDLAFGAAVCRALDACTAQSPESNDPEASIESGICIVPCEGDNDCEQLGAEAACRQQRCELPNPLVDNGGTSEPDPNSYQALCDGTDAIKLAYSIELGFEGGRYFTDYLSGGTWEFLVVDGHCQFWRAENGQRFVSTGTLSEEEAERLVDDLGYGQLHEYANFAEGPCPDAGAVSIVVPDARLTCYCECDQNEDAPEGWRRAFEVMLSGRAESYEGTPYDGPAELLLVELDQLPEGQVLPWPLERAPRDVEIFPADDNLDELPFVRRSTIGVVITDSGEVATLRAARAEFGADESSEYHLPVTWTGPDSTTARAYDLLLRDDLPEHVRAALGN